MLSISLLIVFSVFNLALIAADDQEREELYEELFKALYDRKVDQAKEDLRKNFNDALDRGDDVSKLFECADLKAKCSIVKHCCGDFKCSGAERGFLIPGFCRKSSHMA